MGPTALLPLQRKALCGFLLPLKNPLLRPGLNPRTWGPMASTLTITPLRQISSLYSKLNHIWTLKLWNSPRSSPRHSVVWLRSNTKGQKTYGCYGNSKQTWGRQTIAKRGGSRQLSSFRHISSWHISTTKEKARLQIIFSTAQQSLICPSCSLVLYTHADTRVVICIRYPDLPRLNTFCFRWH
jgi:hypothetical protein